MKRPAAQLAVALVSTLAIAVWLWLRLSAPGETFGAGPDNEAAAASPEDHLSPATPSDSAADTDPEPERGAAEIHAPASQPEASAPRPGRAVRTVRSRTYEPLAGAEVLWWPALAPGQELQDPLWKWVRECGSEAQLPSGAERAQADGEGYVSIPDAPHGVRVLARLPGWFGVTQLQPGETPPLRVELSRDFPLSARAIDGAGGAVAGAHVGLRQDWGGWGDMMLRSVSGADGLAHLPHAGYVLSHFEADGQKVMLGLDEVFDPRVEVEIQVAKPPQEPVTLTMPAGGACEVRIVERDGSVPRGKLEVHLGLEPREAEPDEPFHPEELGSATRVDVEGGTAVFEHVGLGRRLVAHVSRERSGVFHSARGVGPRSTGERTVLEVRLGDKVPAITGRLLGADGAPLADTRFGWRLEIENADESYYASAESRTDAAGAFEFDIELQERGEADFLLALFSFALDGGEAAVARRPLPRRLAPGPNALGDFQLVESPVLATGRVIDGEGAPVGGAWVTAAVQQYWGDSSEHFYWAPLWLNRARSDADGRFTLRAASKAASISLSAEKSERRSSGLVVPVGSSEVELVISEGGEIAGRVLVDESIAVAQLSVHAQRTDSADEEMHFWNGNAPDEKGEFVLRGLQPGTYALMLHHRENWELLAQVADIVVTGAARTRDPRLDPLDLRGEVRAIELAITDTRGQEIDDANVFVRRAIDGEDNFDHVNVSDGKAKLFLRGASADVTVMASGYLTQRIPALDSSRTIELRAGPTLRFKLAEGVRTPEPPLYLGLRLEVSDSEDSIASWYSEQPEFGPDGQARCKGSVTGRVRVVLTVTQRSENEWSSTDLGIEAPTVEILDLPGEQVFEVACTAEQIAAAAQRFQDG